MSLKTGHALLAVQVKAIDAHGDEVHSIRDAILAQTEVFRNATIRSITMNDTRTGVDALVVLDFDPD